MYRTNLVFTIKTIAELIPTFRLYKHMVFPSLYVFTSSDILYFDIYFMHCIFNNMIEFSPTTNYSTVTDFAKFLGISTFNPLRTAT